MRTWSGSSGKLRVLLDTNVWIAATLSEGIAHTVGTRLREEQFIGLSSEPLLRELDRKFRTKFLAPELSYVDRYLRFIRQQCHIVSEPIPSLARTIDQKLRDPNDRIVLEAAIHGQANLITTIDQDLLSMKQVLGIVIVHPRTLLYMI